jgi:hypothetical protein
MMVLGKTLGTESDSMMINMSEVRREQDLISTVMICERYRSGTLDLAHVSSTYRLTRRYNAAWLAGSAYTLVGSRGLHSETKRVHDKSLPCCWKTTGYSLLNSPGITRTI